MLKNPWGKIHVFNPNISLPCSSSGDPSFVQVYCIDVGLPLATKLITICSSSIPTAVDEGGGVNLGGSAETQ